MKRRRNILGTILLAVTVALSYAAASDIAPAVTFPAFIIFAILTVLNGALHAPWK
jgi:hypothetical protein